MTASAQVKNYIANIPEGKTFSSSSLRQLAVSDNIRQILHRLIKAGEIRRVARGVFVKPRQVAKLGMAMPSALEIAKTLAQSTGETITVHGAEAARQLQLTTQVPTRLVLYTSGNSRTLRIANRTVKLIHANPSRLIAAETKAGLVLSALKYLGKENVTTRTIAAIQQRVSSGEFKAVMSLVAHMPAWMADAFYRYQQGKTHES